MASRSALRRAALLRVRALDEVDEHAAALDVAEELVTEAGALVRPLDEPGDVGDDEAPLAAPGDDAEVRDERRERVVGDLRARPGDAADERRLAGVRVADDAHVGEQLQLEDEIALLSRRAVLGVARRLVRGRREVHVAEAAAAALRDDEPLGRRAQVGERPRRWRRPSRASPAARAARAARRRGRSCPSRGRARRSAPGARGRSGSRAASRAADRRPARRRRRCRRRRRPGPPRGMNFSRRHATAPLPPSPAFTWMRTSSTNFISGLYKRRTPRTVLARGAVVSIVRPLPISASCQRATHPELVEGTAERYASGRMETTRRSPRARLYFTVPSIEREQRVVLAHPDVLRRGGRACRPGGRGCCPPRPSRTRRS